MVSNQLIRTNQSSSPSTYSMFFGNLFVYFQFQGKTHIDAGTRELIFSVLISVAVIGVIFLATLRRSQNDAASVPSGGDEHLQKNAADESGSDEQIAARETTVLTAFRDAVGLFCTKEMLLLSVTFLYTGER